MVVSLASEIAEFDLEDASFAKGFGVSRAEATQALQTAIDTGKEALPPYFAEANPGASFA